VLSSNRFIAKVMNFCNPVVLKLFGANINRLTIKNVQACGFNKIHVEHLSGIVKLIVAVK
ncbi:MAG: SAM-dependent methyltransferase, partial [Methylococcaceae bacterium]|nr:SAM-dependent methyltransferase [Methylococcaceae bacterium]